MFLKIYYLMKCVMECVKYDRIIYFNLCDGILL